MNSPKSAIEAIETAAAQLAKKHRDISLCDEIEADLKIVQKRQVEEGDLTNPKDVRALADTNAQLLMLPAKKEKSIEIYDKAAKAFAELLDKALYTLKAAAEEGARNVRAELAKALRPFCSPIQIEKFCNVAFAATWIEALPNLSNSIPLHADFTDQNNVSKLRLACEEIKTKLADAGRKGGYLAAFQEANK
jgi:hypothetical protein